MSSRIRFTQGKFSDNTHTGREGGREGGRERGKREIRREKGREQRLVGMSFMHNYCGKSLLKSLCT